MENHTPEIKRKTEAMLNITHDIGVDSTSNLEKQKAKF